jgi:hypothetical protein
VKVLNQWFDLSKRISKQELKDAVMQMQLYAIKDGMTPDGKEAKRQIREFKEKVREHNKQF